MERFSMDTRINVPADVPPPPGQVDMAMVSGVMPDDTELGDLGGLSSPLNRSPSLSAEEVERRLEERERASMDLKRHISRRSLDVGVDRRQQSDGIRPLGGGGPSGDKTPDDWQDALNARIRMGLLLVSEAREQLAVHSGETGKWVEENERFCRDVIRQELGNSRQPDAASLASVKTTIYNAWLREVENCTEISDPDSHIAFTRLRQAHQILYGEIRAEDVNIDVVLPKSTASTDETAYFFEDEAENYLGDDLMHEQLSAKARLRRWWRRTVFGDTPEEINRPMRSQVYGWLAAFFPIMTWLPEYSFAAFKGDLGAGLSSGAVVVPQAMGYAFLAGLPPIMGLYNAFIPGMIYAVLGTSRHLAIGPAAIASILCRGALGSHNPGSPEEWVALAGMLATLVGINFFIMYLLNLGFLINFLSRPVLSGFATAAAVIIMTSQLGYIFGIHVPSEQYAWKGIYNIAERIHESNPYTLVIAAVELVVLFSIKKFMPKIPRTTIPFPTPLILVVVGLVVSYNVDLERLYGIEVVHHIESGIPAPRFHFQLDKMIMLYKDAWVIPLVGLLEAVSVAKVCAQKNKYELNMRQEYFALGWSNFIGSMFGSYVVLASFGRTALHLNSGGKTHMTNLISVVVVGMCLLFLTEVFKYLPKIILAGIVVYAVSSLIDTEEPRRLYRINKTDFCLCVLTFVGTVVFGVQAGVAIAVGVSVVLILYESSHPRNAACGRLPNTVVYEDLRYHKNAITIPGVMVFRFEAPLYFINIGYFRDRIKKLLRRNPNVHAIVFDASSWTNVDSTGVKLLREILREQAERQVVVAFAEVRAHVMQLLRLAGLEKAIGADHFFPGVHEAVKAIQAGSLKILTVPEEPPVHCSCGPSANERERYVMMKD